MTFDEIRAAFPDLAITLYAMTPGGAVTFEVIAADGATYQFQGDTAQAAIDAAFPPVEPAATEPEPETGSVFD